LPDCRNLYVKRVATIAEFRKCNYFSALFIIRCRIAGLPDYKIPLPDCRDRDKAAEMPVTE